MLRVNSVALQGKSLTLRGPPGAASQPFATLSNGKRITWISSITLASQIGTVLKYVKTPGIRMRNGGFCAVSDIRVSLCTCKRVSILYNHV